jgi:hypothetical protein
MKHAIDQKQCIQRSTSRTASGHQLSTQRDHGITLEFISLLIEKGLEALWAIV